MKKERITTYLFVVLLLGLSLLLFHFFDLRLTGFAVYEQSNQSDFNEGDYNNTEYNGSAVILIGENLFGTYTSKIFGADILSQWNNISWNEILPTLSNTLIMNPTYAEDGWGRDITSKVSALDGTNTWERAEIQTWNDTMSESVTINSVIGYCNIKWIDTGAQIGFQVSRDNGISWDSEICLQNAIAHTTFECDLKTNSGVDTINEINNLQLRCTFPTAEQSKYYSTDWVHIVVNYTSSPTDLKLQVCSNNENTNCDSFIGPDKTTATYYTNANGENLNVSNNQYFQYKFYFETDDTDYTPELQSVSIDYTTLNSPPSWSLIPNQTWDEDTTLTINLSEYSLDPDGNNMGWNYNGVENIIIIVDNTTGIATLTPNSNWFGIEYVIFTATDGIERVDSNNVTLIVNDVAKLSEPVSSSSEGGGGSSIRQYTITSEQASKGYTEELKKNEKIKFSFSDEKAEQHTLNVDYIGENFVNFSIQSNPIKLSLSVGQDAKLNLTSPDYYDLYVKLEGIVNGKAKITIQTIHEEIPSTIGSITKHVSGEGEENKIEEETNTEGILKITGAVIGFIKSKIGIALIFVVLIIVLLVHLKKKKASKKSK